MQMMINFQQRFIEQTIWFCYVRASLELTNIKIMSTVSNKQGGMSGEFEVNEGTSGAAAYDFVQVRKNQENVLLVLLVKMSYYLSHRSNLATRGYLITKRSIDN